MANYFVPLTPQRPGPGLNLEPINAALDGVIQQNDRNRQFGMQQQQIDAQNSERTYQHGRDAKQDALQQVQFYGKQATAVDQMQGPQRAAAWSTILAKHGTQGLSPEELDPVTGPKLMAAQAGQYLDPLKRQTEEAQLGLIRAQTARVNKGVDDPTEIRQRQLTAAGVDPNSPEGKAFLLTGNYNAKPVYTPAETAVDKNYAKSYEADVATGGLADAEKNISQLKTVRDQLNNKDGPNLTGPVLGRVPDAIASFTNPSAVNAREQVEEVVQRNLRLILGAQFTQNEGFALIKRAYNPTLDEKTNAKRLTRLLNTMEQALDAKKEAARYYEQNGTLRGFKGKLNYTINDFDSALDGGGDAPKGGSGASDWKSTFKRVD